MLRNIAASRRGAYKSARRFRAQANSGPLREAGRSGAVLFFDYHRCFLSSRVLAGSTGRSHVPAIGLDENAGAGFFLTAVDHVSASADAAIYSRTAPARIAKPCRAHDQSNLPPGIALVPSTLEAGYRNQPDLPCGDDSACTSVWAANSCQRCMRAHPSTCPVHCREFPSRRQRIIAGAGPHHPIVP